MSLAGVDLEAVGEELSTFVSEVTPENGSRDGFITTTSYATCGRERAIALAERVRPILDALYPAWRVENQPSRSFEFARERDACQRLLSRLASHADIEQMLGDAGGGPALSADLLHHVVWGAAQTQWKTEHRHEAVLAAAKAVNSMLQQKVDRRDLSDLKLIREAFSDKPPEPSKARLRFPGIDDEQTRESLRRGAMDFGAGCFAAIRNPVGHLPNDDLELSEQEALERLAALSLLARWIDEATVVESASPRRPGSPGDSRTLRA